MKHPSDYPCLLLSIQHWQDNAALYREGKAYSSSVFDCACCTEILKRTKNSLFCELTDSNGESICPIYAYTELATCSGTPYEAVVDNYAPPKALVDWLTALYHGKEPELVDGHNVPTDRSDLL